MVDNNNNNKEEAFDINNNDCVTPKESELISIPKGVDTEDNVSNNQNHLLSIVCNPNDMQILHPRRKNNNQKSPSNYLLNIKILAAIAKSKELIDKEIKEQQCIKEFQKIDAIDICQSNNSENLVRNPRSAQLPNLGKIVMQAGKNPSIWNMLKSRLPREFAEDVCKQEVKKFARGDCKKDPNGEAKFNNLLAIKKKLSSIDPMQGLTGLFSNLELQNYAIRDLDERFNEINTERQHPNGDYAYFTQIQSDNQTQPDSLSRLRNVILNRNISNLNDELRSTIVEIIYGLDQYNWNGNNQNARVLHNFSYDSIRWLRYFLIHLSPETLTTNTGNGFLSFSRVLNIDGINGLIACARNINNNEPLVRLYRQYLLFRASPEGQRVENIIRFRQVNSSTNRNINLALASPLNQFLMNANANINYIILGRNISELREAFSQNQNNNIDNSELSIMQQLARHTERGNHELSLIEEQGSLENPNEQKKDDDRDDNGGGGNNDNLDGGIDKNPNNRDEDNEDPDTSFILPKNDSRYIEEDFINEDSGLFTNEQNTLRVQTIYDIKYNNKISIVSIKEKNNLNDYKELNNQNKKIGLILYNTLLDFLKKNKNSQVDLDISSIDEDFKNNLSKKNELTGLENLIPKIDFSRIIKHGIGILAVNFYHTSAKTRVVRAAIPQEPVLFTIIITVENLKSNSAVKNNTLNTEANDQNDFNFLDFDDDYEKKYACVIGEKCDEIIPGGSHNAILPQAPEGELRSKREAADSNTNTPNYLNFSQSKEIIKNSIKKDLKDTKELGYPGIESNVLEAIGKFNKNTNAMCYSVSKQRYQNKQKEIKQCARNAFIDTVKNKTPLSEEKLKSLKGDIANSRININAKDSTNNTVMDYALSNQNLPIIKLLWDSGQLSETEKNKAVDRLDNAGQNGRWNEGYGLIKSGVVTSNINVKLKNGWTWLIASAADNKLDIVEIILKNGGDINKVNGVGKTAMDYALSNQNLPIIKLLRKNLSIITAVKEENLELVKNCIKYNIDLDMKDENGKTALSIAIDSKKPDIIKILENSGKLSNVEKEKIEALYRQLTAHIHNNQSIAELTQYIQYYGLDIDRKNSLMEYPLSVAINQNKVEIVKYLLANGANPNIEFTIGGKSYTAASLAIEKGNLEIMELLFNSSTIDAGSKSLLSTKIENTRKENNKVNYNKIVDLIKAGKLDDVKAEYSKNLVLFLEIDKNNQENPTLLITAARSGNKDIVNFIIEKVTGSMKGKITDLKILEYMNTASNGKTVIDILGEQSIVKNDQGFMLIGIDLLSRGLTLKKLDAKLHGEQNREWDWLSFASIKNNFEAVKNLLTQGAKINSNEMTSNSIGYTAENIKKYTVGGTAPNTEQYDKAVVIRDYLSLPVITAAHAGNLTLLNEYIGYGANLEMKDENGKTAIEIASDLGQYTRDSTYWTIFFVLIMQKVTIKNINFFIARGWTPLTLAVDNQDLEAVKILIEHYKADINLNALSYAKGKKNWDMIKYLELHKVLQEGKDFDRRLEGGWTALTIAVSINDEKSVLELLRRGAIYNVKNGDYSKIPLNYAQTYKLDKMKDILLFAEAVSSRGTLNNVYTHVLKGTPLPIADINQSLTSGWNILNAAINAGRDDVVAKLLSGAYRDIDILKADRNGRIPLKFAKEKGNKKIIQQLMGVAKELLKNKINECNTSVSSYDWSEIMSLLAEKVQITGDIDQLIGSDKNNQNRLLEKAITMDNGSDSRGIIEFLLKNGAKTNSDKLLSLALNYKLPESGQTVPCKSGACASNNARVICLLIQYAAITDKITQGDLISKVAAYQGDNPLSIAVVKKLIEAGFDPSFKSDGKKPAEYANVARNGDLVKYFNVVEALHGTIGINEVRYGNTPLTSAAIFVNRASKSNDAERSAYNAFGIELLKMGANSATTDIDGNAPVFLARNNNEEEGLYGALRLHDCLFDSGCPWSDVYRIVKFGVPITQANSPTSSGFSLMTAAIVDGKTEVLERCFAAGANPRIKDKYKFGAPRIAASGLDATGYVSKFNSNFRINQLVHTAERGWNKQIVEEYARTYYQKGDEMYRILFNSVNKPQIKHYAEIPNDIYKKTNNSGSIPANLGFKNPDNNLEYDYNDYEYIANNNISGPVLIPAHRDIDNPKGIESSTNYQNNNQEKIDSGAGNSTKNMPVVVYSSPFTNDNLQNAVLLVDALNGTTNTTSTGAKCMIGVLACTTLAPIIITAGSVGFLAMLGTLGYCMYKYKYRGRTQVPTDNKDVELYPIKLPSDTIYLDEVTNEEQTQLNVNPA